MSKTIIAFLTKIPNKPLIEIAKKLTDYYDVYIFIWKRKRRRKRRKKGRLRLI